MNLETLSAERKIFPSGGQYVQHELQRLHWPVRSFSSLGYLKISENRQR